MVGTGSKILLGLLPGKAVLVVVRKSAGADVAAIYRRQAGRCTATLVRVLGDVDAAEDAVAEASAVAAQRRAADAVPPDPGGWITTTARNRAIDGARRDARRHAREREATVLHDPAPDACPRLGDLDDVPDDRLRLIFLCCHPALATDAQVVLVLRLLGGWTPDEPEVIGLLAVMLLTRARSPARVDQHGQLVRLSDQDRSIWDGELLAEGHELVRRCLATDRPGTYQLRAAIAAIHADADLQPTRTGRRSSRCTGAVA